MQRGGQGGRLKTQSVCQIPLQRQPFAIFAVIDADFVHQMPHAAVGIQHDVLAVVQKRKTGIVRRQRPRPAARAFPRLEQNHIGMVRQTYGGRQAAPTCADYGDFTFRICHGLNPKNRVFSAMRILRGAGITVLYFSTLAAPSRRISCNSA